MSLILNVRSTFYRFSRLYSPLKRNMASEKLQFPATERNKDPILSVLKDVLQEKFKDRSDLSLLEVASGSGEHAIYLSASLKNITSWLPSDVDDANLRSIKAYIKDANTPSLREPIKIDISKPLMEWGSTQTAASYDIILCVNLLHISPWACGEGLFKSSGTLLKPGGILVTYGPYAIHGEISPESNVNFNAGLKRQNNEWGLRDIDDLEKVSKNNGLSFDAMFDMPANNKTLVFIRDHS